MAWEYRRDAREVLHELKVLGYEIVFLEQLAESTPYQDFCPRGPVCLVLGNEISGVSEELIALCDKTLEIEMAGLKNSLNVAVAFGVVGYHVRNQLLGERHAGNGKRKNETVARSPFLI